MEMYVNTAVLKRVWLQRHKYGIKCVNTYVITYMCTACNKYILT